MVKSVAEEIIALEEEIKNTKGPGSQAKKKELQAKVDELKASEAETVNDVKDRPSADAKVSAPPGSDQDVIDRSPKPLDSEWVACTEAQAQGAEKAGNLYGYDPVKGLMCLRSRK